jgi:UV DNA damage endonuclease
MLESYATNQVRWGPLERAERPHLGLVCVTLSDKVRFRTITRTRYLKLAADEQKAVLRELYSDNLQRLYGALDYCQRQGIKLYRLSSSLFPMSDEATGDGILDEMASQLAEIGKRAERFGLRLVLHPDQFVVLNSETPQVVETSKLILNKHARTLDLMQLPQTAWTTMMIHGGKSGRADQLVETINNLPPNVRNRIAFENDEHAYGAAEILDICQRASVPMVFDIHHHVCHEGLESYEGPEIEAMLAAARATWPKPEWQLVHLSNGKESFNDRRHSDLIDVVPSSLRYVPWIEVEAKNKEEAITNLRLKWPVAD